MLEGIVLAGGFGTRLRPVVADLPKPLAPIAGRPFLEILLTDLARKGFGHVVLSLGYRADRIVAHFGDGFSTLRLTHVIEDSPLGTGGAIRLALEHCAADHVFVFNGDTFIDLEVDALEARWQDCREPMIVGREVPDTARYGRLLVDRDHVVGFAEKGSAGPGLINAGCYVFPRRHFEGRPLPLAFSLESDYFPQAVREQPFGLFVTRGQFIDIGVPEDYTRAQTELASRW